MTYRPLMSCMPLLPRRCFALLVSSGASSPLLTHEAAERLLVFCDESQRYEGLWYRMANVQPFPHRWRGTMASADFCSCSRALLRGFGVHGQTSPGKDSNFPPMYLPHLPCTPSGSIGLGLVLQTRPMCMALYAVRVPQVGSLPRASFRFRLAADTLAVG